MKTKVLITLMLYFFANNTYGQWVVTNPIADFQRALEFAEERQWEIAHAADRAEMIVQLREQLQQLQETRRNIEESYRLQQQVQRDLRVLGSVANGGVASLVHAFEVVLGESLNPADYIPNIPEFRDFKNAMDYNASSQLSFDTRQAHRELFTYNYNDPDNRDGMSLTKNARRLSESLTNLFTISYGWNNYQKELEAQAILQKKMLAEKLREMAKKISEEIQTDELLVMTDAERMELLLKVTELLHRASQLELEFAREVAEKLDENKPSPYELVNLVDNGVRIRMSHTLRETVKPYKTNQKFSLANFERGYSSGQVNTKLESSSSENNLQLKPVTSEMLQKGIVGNNKWR